MKDRAKAAAEVMYALMLDGEVYRAVKYLSDRTVVSACRRFRSRVDSTRNDFVLKVGRPNYLEARFVKKCKAAGEPFPVKKVQCQPWPKARG